MSKFGERSGGGALGGGVHIVWGSLTGRTEKSTFIYQNGVLDGQRDVFTFCSTDVITYGGTELYLVVGNEHDMPRFFHGRIRVVRGLCGGCICACQFW